MAAGRPSLTQNTSPHQHTQKGHTVGIPLTFQIHGSLTAAPAGWRSKPIPYAIPTAAGAIPPLF